MTLTKIAATAAVAMLSLSVVAGQAKADCQPGTLCETGTVVFHSVNPENNCLKVFIEETGNLYALQFGPTANTGVILTGNTLIKGGLLSIVTDGTRTSCGTDNRFTTIIAVRNGISGLTP